MFRSRSVPDWPTPKSATRSNAPTLRRRALYSISCVSTPETLEVNRTTQYPGLRVQGVDLAQGLLPARTDAGRGPSVNKLDN
jgi:hypothetical protein